MKREKSKPEMDAEAGLGTKKMAEEVLNDQQLPESEHVGQDELKKYDDQVKKDEK